MLRHLLRDDDLSAAERAQVLALAARLGADRYAGDADERQGPFVPYSLDAALPTWLQERSSR